MLSFSKLIGIRSQLPNAIVNKYILHGFPASHNQQQIAGLKSVEERIGVPVRPKRPLVPFMRFYKDIRTDLVAQNPAQSMGVLAQLAASKWKQVDQPTKDRYNAEFRQDQEVFLKEIARYQNTLTDEQREKVKQMKLLISEKRKSREKRQKAREMGKPKHPIPAFTQYLTENSLKVDKTKTVFKEFAVKMGEQWRAMSPTEKGPYLDKYRDDMNAYKKEILKWEEKMIKSGNKELVRRKSLLDTNAPVAAAKKKSDTSPAAAKKSPKSPRVVVVPEGVAGAAAERPATIEVKETEEEVKQAEEKRGVRKFLKFF